MACSGCARRASRLFAWLGFYWGTVGMAEVPAHSYENRHVALVFPHYTVQQHHTRATLLALVARLLFGRATRADRVHQVRIVGMLCPDQAHEVYDRYITREDIVCVCVQPAVSNAGPRTASGKPETLVTIGPLLPIVQRYGFVVEPLPQPPENVRC